MTEFEAAIADDMIQRAHLAKLEADRFREKAREWVAEQQARAAEWQGRSARAAEAASAEPTMTAKPARAEFLGSAVDKKTRTLRFLSVSAVEKADPRSGGCLRKWWYRFVGGYKDDDELSAAQLRTMDAGKALHAEIEAYLRTGVKALSSLALAGLHMIPAPGPDLGIEWQIAPWRGTAAATLAAAPLTAAGIPFIGQIDVVHARGTNQGTEEITEAYDPPGTIEVIDWKRKSRALDRDKRPTTVHPQELVRTVQMAGYGEFVRRVTPGAHHVRLSHGYFFEDTRSARKVTRLVTVDDCARTWEYVEAVARGIKDAAREVAPDAVTPNTHACDRYFGCPFRFATDTRAACTAYQRNSLDALFEDQPTTRGDDMSLLQQINPQAPAAGNPYPQPAPAPSAPPPYQPAPYQAQQPAPVYPQAPPQAYQPAPSAPAPQTVAQAATPYQVSYQAPAIAQPPPPAQLPQVTLDLRGQLEAEEAAARAQQAAIPIPGLGNAVSTIERSPYGFPVLGGVAAIQVAQLRGHQPPQPGAFLAGTGQLAKTTVSDPAQLMQMAAEIAAALAGQPPAPVVHAQHNAAPVAVLPPEAPASNPAIASRPPESSGPPPLPPAAPAQKKTRRKKADAASTPTEANAAVATAASAAGLDGESLICVDALPNCEYESLAPYVDAICQALAEKYCTSGIADVRCAPKDGPLGYNGWRGAIRATILTAPPAPGVYYLDTRGGELHQEAADALRTVCEAQGWTYVRGVR